MLKGAPLPANSVNGQAIEAGSISPDKMAVGVMFRVRRSAAMGIGTGYTLIPFNVEDFDTGSAYDTTNSRFIAPVNGYYEFRGVVSCGAVGRMAVALFKNGVVYSYGADAFAPAGSNATARAVFDDLVYLTAGDYVDLRAAADTTRQLAVSETAFSGNLKVTI